ncbi:hypothetical protein Tco_0918511 [Tanacetum coccineum]
MRFMRFKSERFTLSLRLLTAVDEEEEDVDEGGGRGRGTAIGCGGSRWGKGRVRSGRTAGLLWFGEAGRRVSGMITTSGLRRASTSIAHVGLGLRTYRKLGVYEIQGFDQRNLDPFGVRLIARKGREEKDL